MHQKGGPVKVESVEPPQGTTAGGEEISIVGGGFQPGKTQARSSSAARKAESVTIASTTKIRVVTPPNEKGPVDVQVMFDDGATFKIAERVSATSSRLRASRRGGPSSAASSRRRGKIEVDKK